MTAAARFLFSLGCIALALTALPSCSSTVSGPGGKVTKVKTYHLQPTQRLNTTDAALNFERRYHLHGAVTLAEQMERAGQYYTAFWKVDDRASPVTLRFEYRQQKTGLVTKVKEEQVADVRRSNVTKFMVTGAEYQADGPVTAWRISVLRGKDVLVASESYLWK
jgi:hypothetical protein